MTERQPCIYIMASGFNGTLYVGVTSNLIGRIRQHRDGTFGGFASEKRIKRRRREWKMNVIEREKPHWLDLAIGLGFEPLE